MALGNITLWQGNALSRKHQVAAGAAASIKAGDPVVKALGAATCAAAADDATVVATDFYVGIAASTSTDTVAAAGTVEVFDLKPGQVWLVAPKTAATWDTQAEYDLLVGDRLTIDLTAGVYTINAADGATGGAVVEDLNIVEVPGKVAFSLRTGLSYLV